MDWYVFTHFCHIVVVAGCNPGESVFQLYIIYFGDSSSQSLDIVDSESGTTVFSYNGYGKDNTVDIQGLCLKSTRYKVIVRDGYVFIMLFFIVDCEIAGQLEAISRFWQSLCFPCCKVVVILVATKNMNSIV